MPIILMASALIFLGDMLTSARGVAESDWNPVKGPPAGAKYAGETVCAGCHVQEAESYNQTPMAQAGAQAARDEVLRTHPRLTYQVGRYRYSIIRKGDQSIYSVTDGLNTITAPIIWAFGKDVAGETYILRHNGTYYQSRVSFFHDIQGLGTTLGAPPTPPTTLDEAFGERQRPEDIQHCVSCHTTGAVIGSVFRPLNSVPGLGCEACHAPGARHVVAVQRGWPAAQAIFNPARLDAYALDNFCGSCHRTWEQVEDSAIVDVRNVRFQPYRLEKSSCWDAMDSRISCLACHDPHKPLVQSAAFYDSKCLACHLEKGKEQRPQPSGQTLPCRHPQLC